ncbi:ISNCY family transposase, partial [bacterium]|nr:ISNCY family transposase [bacterium]
MGKMLLMSKKEIDRLSIIRDVGNKRMTQKEGVEGLISHKRGKTSNNKITESRKEKILSLIREHYYDFGP